MKNIDVCLELLKKYRIFDASEQTLAAKCAACRSRLSKPSKSNFVVAECGCMVSMHGSMSTCAVCAQCGHVYMQSECKVSAQCVVYTCTVSAQ